MKLFIENNIDVNQRGTVKILPEEPNDVRFVYDLISPGDVIIVPTTRNVKLKSSSRVSLSIEISVTTVDYDKGSSTLRVHGTTLNTNQYVKKGIFHTVLIELNNEFEISKVWDEGSYEKLRRGFKEGSGADLALVLLQPTGFAQVFLVGARRAKQMAKVETHSNPNKYFENIFRAFVKHVDLNTVRCVVIGSEGNLKDEFRRFMIAEANRLKVKSVENNKQRIVVFKTRNKEKDGTFNVQEVLHDSSVMKLIEGTKAVMEIKAFKEFSDLLKTNLDRVCYGMKSVKIAHELKAIETLLITDDLYENAEIEKRCEYKGFVESVKKAGGKAFVFSSKDVSGEVLANLTGIAAILRFPMPDLDEILRCRSDPTVQTPIYPAPAGPTSTSKGINPVHIIQHCIIDKPFS